VINMEYNIDFESYRDNELFCGQCLEVCLQAMAKIESIIIEHTTNKEIIDETINSMNDSSATSLEIKSYFEDGAYFDDGCKYVENLAEYSSKAETIREELQEMSNKLSNIIANLKEFFTYLCNLAKEWAKYAPKILPES